jgi:ribosomal protein S18 acetylase RimI-like enzyme
VLAVFERLGEESRRLRFNGAKPCLRAPELRRLAAVDAQHHALVAYLENDPRPVAIARLVRTGRSAEIAFEVADAYQQRGIGSALTAELVADARAAGITELTALVAGDNRAALALLGRTLGKLATRLEGADRWVSASIAPSAGAL